MRLRVRDILDSEFSKSDSDFEPNFLITRWKRRVHRVKIVGTVRTVPSFGSEGNYARFLLDDSTGCIWVSAFRERIPMVERIQQGDTVQLVATVNEYRGSLELVVECVQPVHPNFWLLHRAEAMRTEVRSRKEYERAVAALVHRRNMVEAKELATELGMDTSVLDSLQTAGETEEEAEGENLSEQILELVSSLDEGKGVSMDQLVQGLGASHSREEIEAGVGELLEAGELYEPTVGRYSRIE